MTISHSDDILVVDDEPDMANGLARVLKSRSYKVRQAFGGQEAVQQVEDSCPRAVVMDIKMPDMNGIDAFVKMKTSCPDLPVVFMTGFSEYVDRAREEGAVAVLGKPLDFASLFECLEDAFEES